MTTGVLHALLKTKICNKKPTACDTLSVYELCCASTRVGRGADFLLAQDAAVVLWVQLYDSRFKILINKGCELALLLYVLEPAGFLESFPRCGVVRDVLPVIHPLFYPKICLSVLDVGQVDRQTGFFLGCWYELDIFEGQFQDVAVFAVTKTYVHGGRGLQVDDCRA